MGRRRVAVTAAGLLGVGISVVGGFFGNFLFLCQSSRFA